MELTQITEYNQEALKSINENLKFGNYTKEPVTKQVTYTDFESIGIDLSVLLDAIETIGYYGQPQDMAVCAGLAGIAKKIIPSDELSFLTELLVKNDKNTNDFVKIETLKNAKNI